MDQNMIAEQTVILPEQNDMELEFVDYELEDVLGGLFPGSSSFYGGACCPSSPSPWGGGTTTR